MIGFITENIGTIITVLILAVIMFFIIRSMIKQRRSGKSACGCSCGSCPMSASCHNSGQTGHKV